MLGNAVRALWAEPRPEQPPVRVWQDWVLLGVLSTWSVLEALIRDELAWRPLLLSVSLLIALTLLWRRTHPLAAVVGAFGVLTTVDIARILASNENGLLWSISGALVLPYSLFRWGAGREAGIGLGVILVWLVVTHVATRLALARWWPGTGSSCSPPLSARRSASTPTLASAT
jgi:hypothetical protein